MKAGQLDQRVSVERLVEGYDELGQPINDWLPIVTTWAEVSPLVGREYIAAQAAVSEVTAKIRMRFRPWMTSQDRVVHNGTVYQIQSVIDVRSENRELHLMCKAVG